MAPEFLAEQERLRDELYEVALRAELWTRLAMLRAVFWGRLGVRFLAAGAARKVIPAIPRSPLLGVWVGQMLARFGGREEACAVYCEVEKLPPGAVEAYVSLGRWFVGNGS